MRYCRKEYVHKDARDIDDGVVFVVYDTRGSWAFAMRINGTFTLTKFQAEDAHEETIRKAKKQILFCKHYGWAYTGQKSMNTEVDELEPFFICLYCKSTTFNTSQPCPCRNKKTEDFLRKTNSGIILPF